MSEDEVSYCQPRPQMETLVNPTVDDAVVALLRLQATLGAKPADASEADSKLRVMRMSLLTLKRWFQSK